MAASCKHDKERLCKEVDLFLLPHLRMKKLVDELPNKVFTTDYSDDTAVGRLLHSLQLTFLEFKHHEEIENRYILDNLKSRVTKSEVLDLLANVHHNTHVKDILALVKKAVQHDARDTLYRSLLKTQLQKAIKEFIDDFVPHMQEEEEIFQPMLSTYFTKHELKRLYKKVVYLHSLDVGQDLEKGPSEEPLDVLGNRIDTNFDKSPISLLPNELLVQIFSHLSPQDLCRCSQVCSTWQRIAQDGVFWQELYPVRWLFQNDWRKGKQDFESCPCEEDNTQNGLHLWGKSSSSNSDESEEEIVQSQLSAKEYYHQNNMNRLILMARYLIPVIGDHVKVLVLCCCPGLTNGLVHKILSYCKNLQFLDLSQNNISDLGLNGLFRKNGGRHLKHVDLSGCAKITDKTLHKLSSALCGKTAKLGSSTSSSDEQRKTINIEIQPAISGLTYLSLSGCYKISDEGLRVLAKYGNTKNLVHLDLSGCLHLSAEGLQDFVSACPMLQHESLFYCDNIAEGPYPETASGCQNLDCTRRVCCRSAIYQ